MNANDRIREAAQRFADEIASALREELRADDVVDQYTSPLGKRRHLEAARRGAFPVTRHGRLVLARRADVDAYRMKPRPGPKSAHVPPPRSSSSVIDEGTTALLDDLGISVRKKAG
jgi:hypothetical protein